ncbi:MAG: hypothetical protein LBG82_04975 [Clostridiales Family XIII bacterium]|nr:hypothetical protein [Clostridiales Family XIII bacterium]
MDEKKNELKTIKVLLIVLIITTAATAGFVAYVAMQWAPVASYYRSSIAADTAYDENGDALMYSQLSATYVTKDGKAYEGKIYDANHEEIASEEDMSYADVYDGEGNLLMYDDETGGYLTESGDVYNGLVFDSDGNQVDDTSIGDGDLEVEEVAPSETESGADATTGEAEAE